MTRYAQRAWMAVLAGTLVVCACSSATKGDRETTPESGAPEVSDASDDVHSEVPVIPDSSPSPLPSSTADGGVQEPVDAGIHDGVEAAVRDGESPVDAESGLPETTCSDGVLNGLETDIDCGAPGCPLCENGSVCRVSSDCASGLCECSAPECTVKTCVTTTCTNGVKDASESDVDCGGSTLPLGVTCAQCPRCGDGKSCTVGTDCANGACDNAVCRSGSSCADGLRNGSESGIDCGGPDCPRCAEYAPCNSADDCVSGGCDATQCADECCTAEGVCSSCADGVKDHLETDVDCGGPGPRLCITMGDYALCRHCPVGKKCLMDADCSSKLCVEGLCTDASCSDGTLNGNEAGIDCGGDCAPCALPSACRTSSDCAEGVCRFPAAGCECFVCEEAPWPLGECVTCGDGVLDGAETDSDCGGDCAACADGKRCGSASDCESLQCAQGVCVSCTDGLRNGFETDVDCGAAACARCDDGQLCRYDTDCMSGSCACVDFNCTEARCTGTHCNNGVQDADESDTDCGGMTGSPECNWCVRCPAGKACVYANDCDSYACVNGMCAAATCKDGRWDGKETGIDCGGPDCPSCIDGYGCNLPSDCAGGVCDYTSCLGTCCELEGVCTTCFNGVKDGVETDVDCGGTNVCLAYGCPPCDVGQLCDIDDDCRDLYCVDGICQAASCTDGVVDGLETDIDCGGGVCPPCPVQARCDWHADCESGLCEPVNCDSGCCHSLGVCLP